MSQSNTDSSSATRPIQFLFENSIFLIAGAVAALVWANIDYDSYHRFVDLELWVSTAGHNTIHFVVNDVLMAFFFAIAGKEVWEAILPGGALSSPRKAAAPLFATAGGMLGPAGLYIGGAFLLSGSSDLINGWAVPTATDIAFSYMIARLIFGPGHPAIAFLLLLAIADDAGGLLILAIFYPSAPVAPSWLLLTAAAVLLGFGLRKLKIQSFWMYLLGPGLLSWFSLLEAGLHPALGLLPMIPTLPHAHTDLGVFAREELDRPDALNAFEHWWKNPVEVFLGLFGLCNAGVKFSSFGPATYLVLLGLLVGKPVGITLFTWVGEKLFRFQLPSGMGYRDIVCVGMIAGIGFTVALFVSTAAFPPGTEVLDAAKMGALLSFSAVILSFVLARILGVRPLGHSSGGGDAADSEGGSDASDSDAQEDTDASHIDDSSSKDSLVV